MDNHLAKAIVDIAVFLEFTSGELLDEDAAIQAMEQLAAELQQMDDNSRRELARRIAAVSSLYSGPQKEFVAGLPSALGLA